MLCEEEGGKVRTIKLESVKHIDARDEHAE